MGKLNSITPHKVATNSFWAAVFFACSLVAPASAQSSDGSPTSAAVGQSPPGQPQTQPSVLQAVSPSYKIGIGDVVAISVYQEDDLTTSARVGEGGLIAFPLLGSIKVGGLSISEATQTITAKLKDGYLVNPVVSLSLMEQQRAKFTLLGQVQRPGQYELPPSGSMALMEAVGLAGGFTRIAKTSSITVQRAGGGSVEVDGKEQASGKARTVFKVLPGDVITIKETFF